MRYLKPDQYFVEAILGYRVGKEGDEYKVKWVGYKEETWEVKKKLNRGTLALLDAKAECGLERTLGSNELWDDFFDDEDSSLFDTKLAKIAFTCCTDKDVVQTNMKKKNRVAAICTGVGANGVVESVYESFR